MFYASQHVSGKSWAQAPLKRTKQTFTCLGLSVSSASCKYKLEHTRYGGLNGHKSFGGVIGGKMLSDNNRHIVLLTPGGALRLRKLNLSSTKE